MAFVEDLKSTMHTATSLLVTQQPLMSSEQFASVVNGLYDSLLQKVLAIPAIGVEQCQEVSNAIGKSMLSEEQKAKLITALTSRCFSSIGKPAGLPTPGVTTTSTKGQTQTMKNPSAFLTKQDWFVLQDEAQPVHVKVERLVRRMRALGLTNPTELTTRSLAAVIASQHCPTATTDVLYSIVVQMKATFASLKHEALTCARLVDFPDQATFLPEELILSAYPIAADDPPQPKVIEGLHALAAKVPLRKTHKAIATPSTPAAAPCPAGQDPSSMALSMLGMLMTQLTGQQQQAPITILGGGQARGGTGALTRQGSSSSSLPALLDSHERQDNQLALYAGSASPCAKPASSPLGEKGCSSSPGGTIAEASGAASSSMGFQLGGAMPVGTSSVGAGLPGVGPKSIVAGVAGVGAKSALGLADPLGDVAGGKALTAAGTVDIMEALAMGIKPPADAPAAADSVKKRRLSSKMPAEFLKIVEPVPKPAAKAKGVAKAAAKCLKGVAKKAAKVAKKTTGTPGAPGPAAVPAAAGKKPLVLGCPKCRGMLLSPLYTVYGYRCVSVCVSSMANCLHTTHVLLLAGVLCDPRSTNRVSPVQEPVLQGEAGCSRGLATGYPKMFLRIEMMHCL